MIEDTIARLEVRLQSAAALSVEQRKELLALLATLKNDLAALSKTNADQAHCIAGYVDLSTREVTRNEQHPHLLRHALEGLSQSVLGMEVRHPSLTKAVNSICEMLSNAGI